MVHILRDLQRTKQRRLRGIMLYLHSLKDAEEVFKALSTPMRLRIMELIYEKEMSMNDLAEALALTNSAISLHVGKLESAGLVTIRTTSGKRGIMKIVQPVYSRMIVDMAPQTKPRHCYQDDIAVGHYTSCDVHPTCGLATSTNIIGELDDPRVFSYPERFRAGILWIGYGSITYNLPNRLSAGQTLQELQISFEISSECPEVNEDYPSDIYFEINGIPLGKWNPVSLLVAGAAQPVRAFENPDHQRRGHLHRRDAPHLQDHHRRSAYRLQQHHQPDLFRSEGHGKLRRHDAVRRRVRRLQPEHPHQGIL